MKQLILVRHSYAQNGSSDNSDFNRALTDKGIRVASKQVILLLNKIKTIDKAVSSDAIRAVQTADIFSKELSVNFNREHFLYEDYTTQDFLNFVQEQPNKLNSLLVIGHNPTLANMAYRLAPEFNHSVLPGTIIIIRFNVDAWSKVEVGNGILAEVIS